MFKVTDKKTGTIQETIPFEMAQCVGAWRDMVSSEHSKDEDEVVRTLWKHYNAYLGGIG